MAWKKESDDVAFDPRALAVLEHPDADDRTLDEVWGYFSRMTAQLAAFPNDDHHVTYATCLTLALGNRVRLELLWEQCEFAGLGAVVELAGGRRVFQVVDDPDFVHVKTASEISFESQRKSDNSKPEITVLVRMRDGDACRYCARVVWFGIKKGDKRGTYDHRPPGQPGSAETSVVACGACNSGRGGLSKGLSPTQGLAAADEKYPLLPVPADPYWTPSTREWLNKYRLLLQQNGLTPPALPTDGERPIPAGDPAPGAAAAPSTSGARPATGDEHERPAVPPRAPAGAAPGRSGRNRQKASLPDLESPGRDGAGRDGPVRDGQGAAQRQPGSRRRGRRGGRSRNTQPRGDS